MAMSKIDAYREKLRGLSDWEPYLLAESGLPGPRGNLELAAAFAAEAPSALIRRYAALLPEAAPTGTAREFLAFCGVLGLGRFLVEGDEKTAELLRRRAADPRWRVREAVAMALQTLGDADMPRLLTTAGAWTSGSFFEQRAAMAALCEPRLLRKKNDARAVLRILGRITTALHRSGQRDDEGFRVLRQALGYGWSVAAAALPEEGKRHMEAWLASDDADVQWILRENLKKNRLARIDAAWVRSCEAKLVGKQGRAQRTPSPRGGRARR
jgi:hypothetical protein